MSGLDIDALRLTEEERVTAHKGLGGCIQCTSIVDAQLAKALWGIMDWLSEGEGGLGFDYNAPVGYAEGELGKALEQANIKRPGCPHWKEPCPECKGAKQEEYYRRQKANAERSTAPDTDR